MCHIWTCFTWIIDIIQRILTCFLAFILCCAISIGLSIAILAGIAYGYNFSITEYLTFSRSDVTVYIRRGQFAEPPELPFAYRRAGGGEAGDEDNMFVSNSSTDYQDQNVRSDSKELSDSWRLAQDTRNYAQKLTRYENAKADQGLRRSNDDPGEPSGGEPTEPSESTDTPPYSPPMEIDRPTITEKSLPTRTHSPVVLNKLSSEPSVKDLLRGETLNDDSIKILTEENGPRTAGGIFEVRNDDEETDTFRKSSHKRKRKKQHKKGDSGFHRRFSKDDYYSHDYDEPIKP